MDGGGMELKKITDRSWRRLSPISQAARESASALGDQRHDLFFDALRRQPLRRPGDREAPHHAARVVADRHRDGCDFVHILAVIDSRSEEHTSELQSRLHLVCRLLLEKK